VGFGSNPVIFSQFIIGNKKTSIVQKKMQKLCCWYAPLRQPSGEKRAILSHPLAIPGENNGCFLP